MSAKLVSAVSWNLRARNLSLLPGGLCTDCLGFLIAWLLSYKSNCPKRYESCQFLNVWVWEPAHCHFALCQSGSHKVQAQGRGHNQIPPLGGRGGKELRAHCLKPPYSLCLSSSHPQIARCLHPVPRFTL